MREVGVSLALRRQKELLQSEQGRKRRREKPSSQSKTISSDTQEQQQQRHRRRQQQQEDEEQQQQRQNPSWQIFIEVAGLYVLCLVLPSIYHVFKTLYRQSWEPTGFLFSLAMYICSSHDWVGTNLQWCRDNSTVTNARQHASGTNNGSKQLSNAMAPDAGISDVAIVVVVSLSMAVVRLAIVHFFVPNYNSPKRLEALVRCKSIHLLSASYTGTVTPKTSIKVKDLKPGDAIPIPTLLSFEKPNDSKTNLEYRMPGGAFKSPTDGTVKANLSRSLRPRNEGRLNYSPYGYEDDLADDDKAKSDWSFGLNYDSPDEDVRPAPAVSSGLMTSSSAHSLQALLEQAAPPMTPLSRRSSLPKDQEPERMFAAPKYATALFRLIFCSVSCLIALLYFLDADFWPPAVGGTGNTKNCWDLSSVGTAVMDSDFDQHNAVLRRYFLIQASYHFHSGAFHLIAALLLWFVSASSKHAERQPTPKKFMGFIPAGMMTLQNVQSLFQHCFAVGLIAGTYLFSSLRRLGAIAMFSFDVSSWFLHLLQLCINSPEGSRRVSPRWIRFLHRALVVPAFCYSRFYVFPFVIAFSAFEESQDWLKQLENMLVPGVAKYMHGMFVVSFCLLMIMNFVYVRRLMYHPHVREALNRRGQEKGDIQL